jgi:hypothetical protein
MKNSAYFQARLFKTQIASYVFTADVERSTDVDGAASLATTVVGTTVNAPSGISTSAVPSAVGVYIIATDQSDKLYVSDGTAAGDWVAADNGNYVLDSSSNATYANKAWSTQSGVRTAITSGRFKSTNNTVLYTCAAGGAVTVASTGRYFNHAEVPTELLQVAVGVTNGTYTTITPVEGQSQLSSAGYLYYNAAAGKTQWEKVTYTSHVHGGVTTGNGNSSAATA